MKKQNSDLDLLSWVTLIFTLIILMLGEIHAGITGKISGNIIDSESNEPLPGVNVTITGSTFGAATDINGNMPHFVVRKLSRILNERKKPLNGSKVLILGIAYKRDTDDTRESPGLEIYQLLKKEKCNVDFTDPYVKIIEERGETIRAKKVSAKMLKKYDCVVVTTDHTNYDYPFIAKHAPLVFDTRNAFKNVRSKKIVRL